MATPLKVVSSTEAKKPLRPMFIYMLNISAWTARGKDDEVTADIKRQRGVADGEKAGTFYKQLLDCPELRKVLSVGAATRKGFGFRTRAWGEVNSMRCGLVQNHIGMKSYIGDMQEELRKAKDEFKPVYMQRIEEERFRLAGMFKEDDYPPVDEMLARYSIRLYTTTLNDPNDFRVLTEIPPAERDALIEETKRNLEITVKGAAKDALSRLYPVVLNVAERLKAYDEVTHTRTKKDGTVVDVKTKIYDSLVENVRIMAEFARQVNLEGDPIVEKFIAEAEQMVADVTAEDLKTSDGQRVTTRTAAEQLADRMQKFFGNA